LVALVGQMPGGAIIDAAKSERFVAGLAIATIGCAARSSGPSTFAATLGTAYRDAHALPPAGTRTGDLLRAAVDPRQIGVASRSNLTEEAPAPTCAPTLTQ